MKKITIIICILLLFLVGGCAQQTVKPTETPIEEPTIEEPEQICTEMWICQDENTKSYRKPDCTFEQITNCPAGCENGECKAAIEEPKKEDVKEELKETKESCTIGWKCLDNKRLGYQYSNCVFGNVEECKYGCKDGKCITEAPPEQKEETFTLTEGKATMNMPGYKYYDFSKNQILKIEVDDWDLKIKLYSKSLDYNYFRAESSASSLWIIEKGITDATRSDCTNNIKDENAYHSLKSGQTLCIRTKEKNIALVGGYWEGSPLENTELNWKYYTPK